MKKKEYFEMASIPNTEYTRLLFQELIAHLHELIMRRKVRLAKAREDKAFEKNV